MALFNRLEEGGLTSRQFFYVCRPKTFEVCADSEVDDGAVEKPRWVEVEGLQVEDFHNHGQLILEALHSV
jgi:hypothetical protein